MTKPDFIIIGAMKSATSMVHEQLALQSHIYMSNPKEPNYFSDDDVYQLGDAWYEALFNECKPDDLCGESSTHYTKLPDYSLTVSRMKSKISSPKFIYIMRHPIERLISHYMHQWSQNVIKCDINDAIGKFPELISYSCYGMQMQPYFDVYGADAVLPVFAEMIKVEPQSQLDRISTHIGYEGRMIWHEDLKPQNVSKQRLRAFKGYDFLVKSKLMTHLRRKLIPQSIRNKVKSKLTMQQRPELTEASLQKIKKIVDEDFKLLSTWLGFSITCDTYHEVISKQFNLLGS